MNVDLILRSKKTRQELIENANVAENKRVTIEWDEHTAKHGNDGNLPLAIALAEMQGDRCNASLARYV